MKDFSHVDDSGRASMVDVSAKGDTTRIARAAGTITMRAETLAAIRNNEITKGDVITVARIAGITGAKKTSELIPLCHQLALSHVSVDFHLDDSLPGIRVESTAQCVGKTGVRWKHL
jgi:cyclic pyranopterin monophosphate synthase